MKFIDNIKTMVESIIDPTRNDLDQAIFNGTEMRSRSIKYFRDIVKEVNELIDVKKAIIKGSILSYQWLPNSDIDILVEVSDKLKEEYVDSIYKKVKSKFKDLKYPGTKHPIQIYLHPGKYNEENADGIYDLDKGWIKGPYDLKVDIKKYLNDFKEIVSDLDATTGELRRNIIDYKTLNSLPQNELIKVRSEIENSLFEINKNIEDLLSQRDDIRQNRNEAFNKQMTPKEIKEYGSKNALPDNVVFKLLERYHYLKFLDELDDIADDGIDKHDIKNISSQLNIEESKSDLSVLLNKINKCLTYRFLTCMESDLNKIGLMIAKTNGGRLILCRTKDSKPCIDKIFEDFIYLTESEKIDESISDKALNVITEFIEKSCSDPVIPENKPRSWQHGPLFYGSK